MPGRLCNGETNQLSLACGHFESQEVKNIAQHLLVWHSWHFMQTGWWLL
jgi:hypothetical protein